MSLVCQHNFLKFFYMFIGAKLKQLLVHNRYKLLEVCGVKGLGIAFTSGKPSEFATVILSMVTINKNAQPL